MSEDLTRNIPEFHERLREYLEAVSGETTQIIETKPIAGGASRETWLLTAQLGDQTRQFVLRRDRPTTMYEGALERAEEARVMTAAFENSVKVPNPRWYCAEPLILDYPFLIMDYVHGESIGRRVVSLPELGAARELLPEQMADQLARIHAIDFRARELDFLPAPSEGISPVQYALDDLRHIIDNLRVASPVLEFGLRWAQEHIPETGTLRLLHGDFRVGNLLINEHGLQAIIDWEFAHLGDPMEDLAWPCVRDWRFGKGLLRLGGVADCERFFDAYQEYSGRAVNRRAVDYWEIMGNLRWAATAQAQAQRHLSGSDPSVEYASLGRRSAEMQMEMLRLIAAWRHES